MILVEPLASYDSFLLADVAPSHGLKSPLSLVRVTVHPRLQHTIARLVEVWNQRKSTNRKKRPPTGQTHGTREELKRDGDRVYHLRPLGPRFAECFRAGVLRLISQQFTVHALSRCSL